MTSWIIDSTYARSSKYGVKTQLFEIVCWLLNFMPRFESKSSKIGKILKKCLIKLIKIDPIKFMK